MPEPIPFIDLAAEHQADHDHFLAIFSQMLKQAEFIGGAAVKSFETAFLETLYGAAGAASLEAVGVANGTDALMLALKTLGVTAGDVVIVPAFTFIATAEAVSMLGAIPYFVDIDPDTYNISVEQLARLKFKQGIYEPARFKALIPVHLYGQAAEMEFLQAFAKEHRLGLVEDCAQAHGAEYQGKIVGSFGDLAAFSFYPTKNLGALGDAGAVVGKRGAPELERLRRLANHGRLTHGEHAEPGVNSRLDALQAAFLTVKLGNFKRYTQKRQQIAKWYHERLAGVERISCPVAAKATEHVYHLYTLRLARKELRASVVEALAAANIGYAIYYAQPLHLQAAYAFLGHKPGDFKVAENLAHTCLSLPMYPGLREEQVDRVCSVLKKALLDS